MHSEVSVTNLHSPSHRLTDSYRLRVVGANLDRSTFKKPPNTYMKVILPATSHRTAEIANTFNPTWNRDFHFDVCTSSTTILLRIESLTKSAFKIVGETKISLGALLEMCRYHCEDVAVLEIRDSGTAGRRVGTIMIQLHETQRQNSDIQKLRQAFDGFKLDADNNLGLIRIGLPASHLLRSRPSALTDRILSRITTLSQIVDYTSKVHPLINLAWNTVSSFHKFIQGQVNVERRVVELIAQMDQTLSFVEDVDLASDKLSIAEATISDILAAIGECCRFLQRDNPGNSAAKRVAHSILFNEPAHKQIEHFQHTLSQLQNRLNGNVVSHLLLTVTGKHPKGVSPTSCTHSDNISAKPPGPARAFTGREDVLTELSNFYDSTSASVRCNIQRVFVLWGLGGSGKTQIALKFASTEYKRFSNIYMIDASSVGSIRSSLTNIGHTAGIKDPDPDKVLKWLSAQEAEWLLIFDNADDPGIDLRFFFPHCSYGNILITTRNPQCRMHALDSNTNVSAMHHHDAVELLLKMAGKPHTDLNVSVASTLVHELGHLALAIVQAGSYISAGRCTLTQYPDLYRTSRAKLLRESPSQSIDEYRETVYTTWEISYSKLKTSTQNIFNICAFLHRDGICEEIFRRAALGSLHNTRIESHYPLNHEISTIDHSIDILSAFRTETFEWDRERFGDIISELSSFSFITERDDGIYSIHPLVQSWSRDRLPKNEMEVILNCAVCVLYHSLCFDETLGPVWLRQLQEKHIRELVAFPHTDGIKAQFAHGLHSLGFYRDAASLMTDVLNFQQQLLGNEHPRTLSTMAEMSRIYEDLGRWNEAKTLGKTVLRCRRRLSGSRHPDTLNAMSDLASTYRSLGEWKQAEHLDNKVLIRRRRSLGDSHPDTLKVMTNLSYTNRRLGQYWLAEKLDLHVYDIRYKIHQEEQLGILGSMTSLALTYRELGRYRQAQNLEVHVFNANKQILGDEHPDTLWSMARIACVSCYLGEVREAETLETQVLEGRKRILGAEHCDTLEAMTSLSWTYRSLGRHRQAVALDISVLEVRKRLHGEEHPDTLWAMANLAWSQRSAGDYQNSQTLATKVLEARRRSHGEEHPDTLRAMASLASTYKDLGYHDKAEDLEVQVLKKRKQLFGHDHSETLRSMSHLACTYNHLGHHEKAEMIELDALGSRKRLLGEKHPDTLSSMDNLAEAYRGLGKYQDAETLEVQVVELRRRSLGDEHPDTLCAMANLASTHKSQGNDTTAEALEVQVFEARKRVLGDRHPDTLNVMSSLASTYRKLGDVKKAETFNNQVLQVQRTFQFNDIALAPYLT